MNDLMTRVAEADPGFARSLRRNQVLSYIFAAIAVLAIGSAAWAVGVNFQQDTQITKIESPCIRYGSKSPQCKEAFEAAVATITHPQACAIERKAGTLRAIRELADSLDITFNEPCAGARIAQERQRGNERAASRMRSESVARQAPVSTPGVESPRTNGGSIDTGEDRGRARPSPWPRGGGGDLTAPTPDATPPAPQPAAASAPPPAPVVPPVTPPVLDPGKSGLVKPTLEGIGKTVQETGGAVRQLPCSVTQPVTGICLK
jgi:hypothetical protein